MDVIVTASRSVNNAELEAVEPFDLRTMRRYSPALLSGWLAEEPTMAVAECAALARQEALAKIGQELAAFMPGDSHRDLWFQTGLDRESADLICLPLWVLAIRHAPDEPPFRMLINGQTGKIYGKAPLSWVKILLVVLALLALLATPFIVGALTGSDDEGSSRSGGRSGKAKPAPTEEPTAPTATATSSPRTPATPTTPTATGPRPAKPSGTTTTTPTKTATSPAKPPGGASTAKGPGGRTP
jgi:cell division septation protein DedD